MKKIIAMLILLVFAAGLVLISSDTAFARRKKKDKEKPKVEEVAPTLAAAEEAIVVATFESDEEMSEFEQLYVSKQATFGRIGVLQAYFVMEQNNLLEIDRQIQEKFGFKMDPAKMYDLNRDNKEIRELGAIPVASPAAQIAE